MAIDPTYPLVGFFIFRFIIMKFGGWQIAYLRFRGIPYHQIYIHLSSSKFDKFIVKDSKMENYGSIIAFSRKIGDRIGDYILGDQDSMFLNPYGAPSFEYKWNDSRPLEVNKDYEDVGQRCDPLLIHAGLHNKVISEFHGLTKKAPIIKNTIIFAIVFFTMLLLFVDIYYNYNTACALKTLACGGGHP